MNVEVPAAGGDVEMGDADQEAGGLPNEVLEQIVETHQKLSATRKKRKAPEGYATPADVKSYTAKHTVPSLHSPSPAGITSVSSAHCTVVPEQTKKCPAAPAGRCRSAACRVFGGAQPRKPQPWPHQRISSLIATTRQVHQPSLSRRRAARRLSWQTNWKHYLIPFSRRRPQAQIPVPVNRRTAF